MPKSVKATLEAIANDHVCPPHFHSIACDKCADFAKKWSEKPNVWAWITVALMVCVFIVSVTIADKAKKLEVAQTPPHTEYRVVQRESPYWKTKCQRAWKALAEHHNALAFRILDE